MQGTDSNFETDLFMPMIEQVEKLSNCHYNDNKLAFRVIADHIRAITFATADGEMFSNEGRGYVLRRLLRRAERFGRVLGINDPFLYKLVDIVVEIMKDYYPYLLGKQEFIKKIIKAEEEKFIKTLSSGENMLKKMIQGNNELSAADMFLLSDTFGFPKELTMEMCDEQNVKYDLEGFNALLKEQKERARKARGDLQSMNKQSKDLMDCTLPSEFTYGSKPIEAKVIALFENGVKVDSISSQGEVMLDKTTFYAESGGQVCDTGVIENNEVSMKVENVIKAPNKQHLHTVQVLFGELKVGDTVTVKIDENRRNRIARNHSSVHLLQRALTDVLGDHIAQHGSYVSDEYIHFDFNHYQKITNEELNEVERKVNAWIDEAIEEETKVLPIEEAKKLGARALFDDKYGDTVRVVCFGDVSKEFCGGTHVKNTQDIGVFAIEYEESVAAGVRRIQARTSIGAFELMKRREVLLARARDTLGASSYQEVNMRLNTLVNDKDNLKKANEALSNKLAHASSEALKAEFKEVNGLQLLVKFMKDNKRNDLMSLVDNLKGAYDNYLIVLIGEENGGLPIVVSASKEAIAKGFMSGKVVKDVATILGGSGGGRPDVASGAGRNYDKISSALEFANNLNK